MAKHYKVEVFVPEEYVVDIVNGLNGSSILKHGHYDYLFATSKVTGHFRPIEGANPFNGEIGIVQELEEIKIEFKVRAQDLDQVKKIIEAKHPYEEPVVNIIELAD